ncbi:hypothetical protein K469DRAFT_692952 [Zopfia rhizophila CBS 207.26]|uniref:Uncharacterized protein n=1 Tax=Zopfia rhizophila CBS 207.26 TaxID=1314779 RepID=A0A6A6DR66_9PEZI|nr:hypothetical protein K469DRAFT_692952 [Zopfia rhizophila CBS 207.26]
MAADRPQRARRAPSKLTEQAAVAGVPSSPLLLPQQPLQQPEGLKPAVDLPALLERPVTPRALSPTLSRPAGISSPLPQPEFDVEVDYKLIVNGKSAVHRAPERHDRFMWWLDDVEKVVNEMLEQPEARLNGRDYEIESRTVGFRAGIKTRIVLITLADFSQVEETKFYRAIDYQVSKTPGVRLVEVKQRRYCQRGTRIISNSFLTRQELYSASIVWRQHRTRKDISISTGSAVIVNAIVAG